MFLLIPLLWSIANWRSADIVAKEYRAARLYVDKFRCFKCSTSISHLSILTDQSYFHLQLYAPGIWNELIASFTFKRLYGFYILQVIVIVNTSYEPKCLFKVYVPSYMSVFMSWGKYYMFAQVTYDYRFKFWRIRSTYCRIFIITCYFQCLFIWVPRIFHRGKPKSIINCNAFRTMLGVNSLLALTYVNRVFQREIQCNSRWIGTFWNIL